MSTAIERIEVFKDTIDWINSDQILSASVSKAKKNTEVYYEDDYPDFDASITRQTVIEVTGERSYESAMRLAKEDSSSKIAVMNFANAFHAGCQTAHCGRRKPHFDFGGNTSPIVPYRHLPQTLRGLTADCRSLV